MANQKERAIATVAGTSLQAARAVRQAPVRARGEKPEAEAFANTKAA